MITFRLLPLTLLALGVFAQAQLESAFEVASVRITAPASLGFTSMGPLGQNRYEVSNATLNLLVQIAYGVPFEQISKIETLGSEHYDISAKAEDGVLLTPEQLQPRLQRLLKQRFKLVIHREVKDFNGYALTVAKNGPKLTPTTGGSDMGVIYPGGFRLLNLPVSSFAASLRSPAGRPVVDKTGITGNYDFKLSYSRDEDPDSALPSFFTALEEEFGLKLESTKVPLEIVVIDGVSKIPTDN